MTIWKNILNYFTDEKEIKEERKPQNPEANKTVLKSLFTKTDPHSITEFPYSWKEEFFPPLDHTERKYILEETVRWHSIYLDISITSLIELISYYISRQPKNAHIKDFMEKQTEEYQFIAMELIHLNYLRIARERLEKLRDGELLNWIPIKGEESYEPSNDELSHVIHNLSLLITEEANHQIVRMKEEGEVLEKMQSEMVYSEQSIFVKNHIEHILNSNKSTIAKYAYDRLMLEYIFFPQYEGKIEKVFKNKIFYKYKDNFGVTEFNQMMGKVYVDMEKYQRNNGKDDMRIFVQTEWSEFCKFMVNEYSHMTEEELQEVKGEDFNIYKLSLDFFCILLFKIYLDGMK